MAAEESEDPKRYESILQRQLTNVLFDPRKMAGGNEAILLLSHPPYLEKEECDLLLRTASEYHKLGIKVCYLTYWGNSKTCKDFAKLDILRAERRLQSYNHQVKVLNDFKGVSDVIIKLNMDLFHGHQDKTQKLLVVTGISFKIGDKAVQEFKMKIDKKKIGQRIDKGREEMNNIINEHGVIVYLSVANILTSSYSKFFPNTNPSRFYFTGAATNRFHCLPLCAYNLPLTEEVIGKAQGNSRLPIIFYFLDKSWLKYDDRSDKDRKENPMNYYLTQCYELLDTFRALGKLDNNIFISFMTDTYPK